jgi:long-chain acyl-CoA synthetase
MAAESIDTVPQNLQEVQPTLVMGVPRIWEKLLASAQIRLEDATWLKRKWSGFWLARAERIGDALVSNGGRHTPASRTWYVLGWICMYRALRVRTGLRYARYAVSGAAPIAPEVLKFFMGIGVPMHELYGMTENSAIATTNKPGRVKLGTVGEPHEGTELKIDETTGEILVRSPAVFAGYWRNPEKTAETIDAEGWLHTGDVGEWVDGTHVTITDRMKDIIITAGGKNISPSEIENKLKVSPFVREAIVIGDRRKYLTALIGVEFDTVGDWASRQRIPYTTYEDLSRKPEVVELISGVVDGVNAELAQVETIKRFTLLPKELDAEEGELTATQKVKRAALSEQFEGLIEAMYR